MGSVSDRALVEKAEAVLAEFGVAFTTLVLSAHRTPDALRDFALRAKPDGIKCIIAAAGKAAALPGAIAAYTSLPVIGLPIRGSALGGLDSLLSIVQMPKGVPVATVAIDGAENSAILAVQILALSDDGLTKKLNEYKLKMREEILNAA
jgi:5-(carboxyamino)imidazole ribonucleotide mutase